MTAEVGKWNPQLHAEYRAMPEGSRKRALAGRIIRENEPLIKTIVNQLINKGAPTTRRKSAAARMGGCQGLGEIEWEDAMQAGRIAMLKAIGSFDPSKGKIAFHFLMQVRYQLQKIETFELHLARSPQGKADQRPKLGLVGMPATSEEHSASSTEWGYVNATTDLGEMLPSMTPTGSHDRLGVVAEGVDWVGGVEGVTPELLAEWEETGEWPDSVEAFVEARKPAVVYSIPKPALTGWSLFLGKVKLAVSGRVGAAKAFQVYAMGCAELGERWLPRAAFFKALEPKLVRQITIGSGYKSEKGLAGLRLVA